ncbi:phytoene desaturase family protein [Fructilactobacillus carniphilus]|uniref:Phytoene desaturase family protein n=1 Tax=Fructilactobacillus carniphilus TaxID=2940297 RepID=A0ABY5BX28_9LACO|nr:phytoene desaturase family protein [Fructilactobacillus carniphilus]USS90518.1 phytoene desaturase family protein [Fructilactobacillus carniphilus]
MKQKVSVIGAGVGGLTAALKLQSQGYEVTIFEKNHQVGGKMNRLEVDGYRFDMGPTIVMMPDIYRKPFLESGVDPDDYFTMQRVDPFMTVEIAKQRYPISSDLVRLTQLFEGSSDADMAGFLNYLADIYQKYLNAKDNFIYKSFRTPRDFFNWKTLKQALQLKTFSSSYHDMQKFIPNQQLQYLLSFQTLYIGISPFSGPSIYNIIPMIELLYGVWYIDGGMYQYALALQRRFTELGGTIKLNQPVEAIETNRSQVTGIKVAGQTLASDAVVVNADYPYAVEHLLDQSAQRLERISEKEVNQKMQYSMSCLLLYLGVDCQYEQLGVHTIKMATDFKRNLTEIETGVLPNDPSYYLYNPSAIDASVAPAGASALYVLVPVANLQQQQLSETEVQDYVPKILRRMETDFGLTDLQKWIQVQRVFTPSDFKEFYNSKYGTAFGLKPTLLQSNYFRPHNKARKIQGLYFAGASTHPGAGVPIVVTSGELAAQELEKDLSNE